MACVYLSSCLQERSTMTHQEAAEFVNDLRSTFTALEVPPPLPGPQLRNSLAWC
jgi:hypothetical protein